MINKAVNYFNQHILPHADERSKDWFLLNSNPIPVWIITIAYLSFVIFGMKYMAKREAFKLQKTMVVYNLVLVIWSLYIVIEISLSTWNANYDYICAPLNDARRKDPREYRVAAVLWWYFFSKVVELFDTVLMVLRKKNNQITFLHVFHHASMLNIWWWVESFIPGGLSYFGAWLNSIVHVVMYSYYAFSAVPTLRRFLWWKKYITKFQLIQFCITLTHTLNTIYQRCDFPEWGKHWLGGYMIVMLILFSNFYIHTYIKNRSKSKNRHLKNGINNGNGLKISNESHLNEQNIKID